MGATSHPVKRTDGSVGAIPGEVDINEGGTQGLMSKELLDGEQVGTVFVQMGTAGMPEGMAGEPPWPSEAVLVGMDVPGKEERINGLILSALFWEEISRRFIISKPVLCKDVKGGPGKKGIAVGAVFPMGDVDTHIWPGDVPITEGTDLADA